jgi:hypothetical protein
MRSFSWAVKIRRRGRAVSSGDAETGAATVVGLRPSFVAAPASAAIGVGIMGMSKIILQHPQG